MESWIGDYGHVTVIKTCASDDVSHHVKSANGQVIMRGDVVFAKDRVTMVTFPYPPTTPVRVQSLS